MDLLDNFRECATVNTINVAKGFGFLKLDSGNELFFHSNQLRNCEDIRLLREGDTVEYTQGPDAKNPAKFEAKDVEVKVDVSTRTKLVDTRSRHRSRSPARYNDYDDQFYHPRERARSPPHYSRGGSADAYRYRGEMYARGPYRRSYAEDHYREDPYQGGEYRDRYSAERYSHRSRYDPPRGRDHYRPRDYDRGYPSSRREDYQPDDSYRRRSRTPPREEGTVKTLTERGYGFVDINGKDFFFPAKEVVNASYDDLKQGDNVSCLVGRDPRDHNKFQAQKVRLLYECGNIESLKNNFGYIKNDMGEKIFFHARHLEGVEFEDVTIGMRFQYKTVVSRSHKDSFEAQRMELVEEKDLAEEP